MKLIRLFALTIFLISSLHISAQISEQETQMSQGTNSALVIDMPNATMKNAEKVWKSYAKKYGKVLRDKKHKEHYVLDAIIPDIDPEHAVSVFLKLEEFSDMTRANLFVKSDGSFVSSADNKEYIKGAGALLTEYSNEVKKVVIGEELKKEEKMLQKLEKELTKLVKQNEKLHKNIEKAKEVIRKSEEELEKNATSQEEKKKEIEQQKTSVNSVNTRLNNVGKN